MCQNIVRKKVKAMKCLYKDGLRVEYRGSLLIKDNNDINVYIKEGKIPLNLKGELDVAVMNYNCTDMRNAAETATHIVGKRACIH
jgi:hypothetical protein